MVAKRCSSTQKLFSQLHKTVHPVQWKPDDCYTFQVFFSEWIILRRGKRLALLSSLSNWLFLLEIMHNLKLPHLSFNVALFLMGSQVALNRAKFVWQLPRSTAWREWFRWHFVSFHLHYAMYGLHGCSL